ncbi:hypothetical protein [Paraburkholderia piptadeniae]|uniref:hypothetical protein n=1 Tax=Paraburkholderia piptadeniae TaxID=1701573 RepID=UPI00117D1CB6|nr:hypothetical protein [Paraburkholderia piptadeniae]
MLGSTQHSTAPASFKADTDTARGVLSPVACTMQALEQAQSTGNGNRARAYRAACERKFRFQVLCRFHINVFGY